jgi:Uma2 family endonuclease
MEAAAQTSLTAEAFLATDQSQFGSAWRYELVDGRIVGYAAPAPAHGAILAGLAVALGARLRGSPDGCRPEIGSGAAPRHQQRATARIPDATIRCGDLPRVVFEVVSPSELRTWHARDRKRRDLQEVEGVMEIVEIYQDEPAIHVYRREAEGTWSFDAIGGLASELSLRSVPLSIPMAEIYEFASPGDAAAAELG